MERLAPPDRSELANRFVSSALLPFLFRCRPLKKPDSTEVAALLWGFSAGLGVHVSPYEVARVLRGRISKEEADRQGGASVAELIEALVLTAEVMPDVAAAFWFDPDSSVA